MKKEEKITDEYVTCSACRGRGDSPPHPNPEITDRTCASCNGSGEVKTQNIKHSNGKRKI